jgi:uncharacterized protein YgiM (DUF1202 family)
MSNSQAQPRNRFIWLLIVLLLLMAASASAANEIALSARIVNADVTYSIVSAQRRFTLREDAQIALRAGDTLTTERYGRAYLRFADSLELLILPNSTIEIIASQDTDSDEKLLSLRLTGIAIARYGADSDDVVLEIETSRAALRTAGGWFAMWSNYSESDAITVAEGRVEVIESARSQMVTAGEGLLINDGESTPVALEAPYNGARVIGIVDGCDGRVSSTLPELNIRAGTSLGYTEIGFINNGASLRLVGRTIDGIWYRIQRFSGFGWVLASAVETDCVLPEYPNLYGEDNRELFDVEGIELVLLTPFYGNFDSDPWFYRWLEAPSG